MKDTLNSRSDKFTIVLNDSGANVFKDTSYIVRKFRCCDDLCVVYISAIKHDLDEDKETQTMKTTHYHVVIQFDRNYRLGTILNLIVELFHCNANQVTIDKCTSLIMQTRYLVHLDDFEKHQYQPSDVVTNNEDFFKECLTYIKSISSVSDLIAIIKEYPRLQELIGHIGLENYKKYRIVIQDLRREINEIY